MPKAPAGKERKATACNLSPLRATAGAGLRLPAGDGGERHSQSVSQAKLAGEQRCMANVQRLAISPNGQCSCVLLAGARQGWPGHGPCIYACMQMQRLCTHGTAVAGRCNHGGAASGLALRRCMSRSRHAAGCRGRFDLPINLPGQPHPVIIAVCAPVTSDTTNLIRAD